MARGRGGPRQTTQATFLLRARTHRIFFVCFRIKLRNSSEFSNHSNFKVFHSQVLFQIEFQPTPNHTPFFFERKHHTFLLLQAHTRHTFFFHSQIDVHCHFLTESWFLFLEPQTGREALSRNSKRLSFFVCVFVGLFACFSARTLALHYVCICWLQCAPLVRIS